MAYSMHVSCIAFQAHLTYNVHQISLFKIFESFFSTCVRTSGTTLYWPAGSEGIFGRNGAAIRSGCYSAIHCLMDISMGAMFS